MQQRSNLPLSFFSPTPSIRQDYAKLVLTTAVFVMMLLVGLLSAHAAMTARGLLIMQRQLAG